VTKEQFDIFWKSKFPNTIPISYRFRDDYPDRWFRIHSLPQSKRYAETESDWSTLLIRQNQIITDLVGEDSNVIIVTGEFNSGEQTPFITDEEMVFTSYTFTRLDNIDLYKLILDDYDKDQIYRLAFAETTWKQHKHDKLLREIALDNVRVFFASIDKNIIIAPYDGGIDFILKDAQTRDIYKIKYSDWLSLRNDGL
jgi:hypothetical protein